MGRCSDRQTEEASVDDVSFWHIAADLGCPLSRQLSEAKLTCHGRRKSDVHDPEHTNRQGNCSPAFLQDTAIYSSNFLLNSASSLSRSIDRKNATGLHFP